MALRKKKLNAVIRDIDDREQQPVEKVQGFALANFRSVISM
jgi:hypothetical protein